MRSSPAIAEHNEIHRPSLQALADRWWVFLLRGAASVIFGVLTLVWPGATLLTLVVLYGIFALTDGVLAIVGAIRGAEYASRWWLASVGLFDIAAGAIALLWPGITSFALLLCIGVWAIATGVAQVAGAISMRDHIDHEWSLIAGGTLSIVFGTLLLTRPATGAMALILAISAYAIMYGVILIALASRLWRYPNQGSSLQP